MSGYILSLFSVIFLSTCASTFLNFLQSRTRVQRIKFKRIFFCDLCNIFFFLIVRGVIDIFVSFFHRIIIYWWIYIIFCHYQQQSVVNRNKSLKCKVRQTCDVTMMLMTSHVGDVVVKTLEDRCGWCIYLAINAILPMRVL